MAINCAAIPETLLETELFGHEKGAFTGAVSRKPGKFEMAHRGTLFLDEIGDLPLALQAKILRALEERRFERVGGTALVTVDVRLVAATNRGLRAAVAARRFREDLFFRLSVFPITVPPLRDRGNDIPLLARYFVDRFCRDLKKKPLVVVAGRARCAAGLSMARQRARAAELHRAGGHPGGRGFHPAASSQPVLRRRVTGRRGAQSLVAGGSDRHARRRHQASGGGSGAVEDPRGACVRPRATRAAPSELLQISYKNLLAKLKEHAIE